MRQGGWGGGACRINRPSNTAPLLVPLPGQVVGRLAPQVARLLMGKHKPTFCPHVDCGDWVVIINARHAKLTGKKMTDKLYKWHTQFMGGLHTLTARQVHERAPERILEHAIRGMMPGNILRHARMRRLRVFADAEHSHSWQTGQSQRYAPDYLVASAPIQATPRPQEATGALVKDVFPGVRDPVELKRLAKTLPPIPPAVAAERLARLEALLAAEASARNDGDSTPGTSPKPARS
jgi:large subunit ribosomal protein L13